MDTVQKLNELNRDIWGLIVQAQKAQNMALIEVNLKRLYSLQKKYINIINLQDYEIKGLKLIVQDEKRQKAYFEKEWFKGVAQRSNNYQHLKEEIDKYFSE
jgi:hypothetical protein